MSKPSQAAMKRLYQYIASTTLPRLSDEQRAAILNKGAQAAQSA